MRETKDRSSKWLIEHHGDSILFLAGVAGFSSWRAVQAEVVLPKQLPDGFLEVSFPGEAVSTPFLVEIAAYPDRRIEEQMLLDAVLVLADRRVLPEVLTLILHPLGTYRLSGTHQRTSAHGLSRMTFSWRVVELWTLSAADLLAANDVGLIPWVPLTQYDGLPEVLIQQCRDRIDQQAPPENHANLLAVTQVMTRFRYNDPQVLSLLGGSRAMIESPLIQELLAQKTHQDIVDVLESRFGAVPPELTLALRTTMDETRLRELNRFAAVCPDLVAFQAQLAS